MSDTDEQPISLRFMCDVDDVPWTVSGMHMYERFNEPYALTLRLHSDDPVAEPIVLLGESATLLVERGTLTRELCGIIESVEDGLRDNDHVAIVVTIVPALMALGHRRNSRIFQEMTIPEILEQVLSEGLGGFERSVDVGFLTATYPAQEYTVQYQETDFDFVHRLMEEHPEDTEALRAGIRLLVTALSARHRLTGREAQTLTETATDVLEQFIAAFAAGEGARD